MLKKFVVASAILASTATVAFANGAPYVGASLGVNSANYNTSYNLSPLSGSVDFGGRNAIGNLFAGYGALVSQNIYLGGEVFADLTNTSSEVKVLGGSTEIKTSMTNKYGYGVSVIPGLMLSDHTMLYGRAGLVRSRFDSKLSATSGVFSSAASAQNTVTGGQLGLGVQTSLTQNVDLRAEYDYTQYRAINFNDGMSVKPRTDSFNLGLVYKFD